MFSVSFKKIFLISCLITLFLYIACSTPNDSVVESRIANTNQEPIVSPSNSKFLVEMANARMMDLETSKLAFKKGTSIEVKIYGKNMQHDQEMLLKEIKSLAQMHQVILPTKIGSEGTNDLNTLKKLTGRDFDKKYLVLIQKNHERDVQTFKKLRANSNYPGDENVTDFAKSRLPLIKSHLEAVKRIRKTY